ncbi:MAG: MFS transporter [Phycisphaeraceae bacterium]|nr:MFS transporter [Phycisphaerales bacterium]MCB9841976.1 MFS transporter [Phycisphaeraceae bacterium]
MMLAPVRHLARYFGSFHPVRVPAMSRRAYRWELTSACFMPASVACVEGAFIGVIAQKSFGAGNFAIATITASTTLAMLTTPLWTRFAQTRDRVRVINAMQLAVIASVLAMALLPFNKMGLALLVATVLAARCFLTGITNTRTDLWRSNYPRHNRASLTGKFTIVSTLVVTLTSIAVGLASDFAPNDQLAKHAYRGVFVLAVVLGAFGVWSFSHVPWRGRAASLKVEREHRAQTDRGDPNTPTMWSILREDHAYRKFMFAQFVLGVPNLAATAPFIMALKDPMGLEYGQSIALAQTIPVFVTMLAIPFWSIVLDRTHIVRFRVFHSWFFVVANLLMGVGVLTQTVWVLYLARVILGMAFGGGVLAWNLGHHDYAPKHLASLYMGIHVTLTGIRGMLAPYAGALLYSGIPTFTLLDTTVAWSGLGGWLFILLSGLSAAGAILFLRLYIETRHTKAAAPADG